MIRSFIIFINIVLLSTLSVCAKIQDNTAQLLDRYSETDSIIYLSRAFTKIDAIEDNSLKADIYRLKGNYESHSGSDLLACSYLYKAIDLYKLSDTDLSLEWQAACYYRIFVSYFKHQNIEGLSKICNELKLLRNKNIFLNTVQFYYYLTIIAYNGLEYNNTQNKNIRDSIILNNHIAISYLNKISINKRHELNLNSTLPYYNMVVAYFTCFSPPRIDSVLHYTQLAEKNIHLLKEKEEQDIFRVNVIDAYAWTYMFLGKYDIALEKSDETMKLIREVENTYSVNLFRERGEVYRFYVEYYEKIGDHVKALKYQKLISENSTKLYSADKNEALNSLRLKYEVDQKEADIVSLNNQVEQQKTVIHLTIIIIIIVVILLFITALLAKSRKKQSEQKLYEEALEADIKRESQYMTDSVLLEKMKIDYPSSKSYFDNVNLVNLIEVYNSASSTLTSLEKKYIICFMAGMSNADIADMFKVEPRTAYTVKYRMKKKFTEENFPF